MELVNPVNQPLNPSQASPPQQSGSIAEVSQRLALWAKPDWWGLARVEYSSEFARQKVIDRLRIALSEQKISLQEITLPQHQPPEKMVQWLLTEFQRLAETHASSLVSITGLVTAFDQQVPMAEALRVLNFNRERLADFPFQQIWWMTPVLLQQAIHAMPDLDSWFSPRLRLTEVVLPNTLREPLSLEKKAVNVADAHQRATDLLQRFQTAQAAGANDLDLLKTYLLPSLEALAEVDAQQELRDLTLQFEGILGQLKQIDTPEMADGLNRLAILYYQQGRYSEAEPLFLKALQIQEVQFGADHIDVAINLNNLAQLYEAQGRYQEAEPIYLRSLHIRESQLGHNHPYTAISLNNLAQLYESQGRYQEAEPIHLRSLHIQETQLGNHPYTAISLNGLAQLYESQGRYQEAEPLLQRSLHILETQLGVNHPHTAVSLNNLAGLYESQGRYGEAEPLYQRSLHIHETQLGVNHPNTATSLNNLAVLYRSQGHYSKAEPLYQRALHIREAFLGANHPDTADSLNNLAALYEAQGNYSKAEPLFQRSLHIRETQLGADHPRTITGRENLALLYDAMADSFKLQGRYEQANEYLEKAIALRSQNLS